jgi:multidrug transporter EmrE-like cation transporter
MTSGGGLPSFNFVPLGFGIIMAIIDVLMISLTKLISKDTRLLRWMIVPTLIYAVQPWIFLKALSYETLVVMNLLWDVLSDVLVTFVGMWFFKEKIGIYKLMGVMLSFVSITLLSLEDGPMKFGFE